MINAPILNFPDWLATAPGQYLLEQEQRWFDDTLVNVFGYHALQLGLPGLDTLRSNRMPLRWLASEEELPRAALITDFQALPFPENSLDLVVLPHTLESSLDPHAVLREVARVLVPEGRVLISGFNTASLWGWRQRRARFFRYFGQSRLFLPEVGEFISYLRLRDWLRLLNLELQTGKFACYRPAVDSSKWLERFAWMDQAGDRWWPVLGAVYFLEATKRVHGARLMGSPLKSRAHLLSASIAPATKVGVHD